MPQLNSDEAATDEPTAYSIEECEDDRWNENLNDIKGDLVQDIDKDPRGAKANAGEPSNNDRLERGDARDDPKVPGRPYIYPTDIGSIVSSIPSFFPNGGLPPNSKVPYPYHPYHHLFYGSSGDIDSKTGMSRSHHPDIPAMYSLPGQLGQIPHPLAPWPAPPIYPICTASTMAPMLPYANPFAAFTSAAAAAASSMPRFAHRPGMHPTMIPHPALVSNGPLGNMPNGKHDEKSGRHSKGESEGGRTKRDRPYVKKPLNAFMLYMKEQRAKVVAECTLKESAAINQILGRKWHSLSRDEQQKYYEMARKERQLHLQMYPGWSARDNYGKRKKRKKEKNQGECTDLPNHRERSYSSLAQPWAGPASPASYTLGVLSRFVHPDRNSNNSNNNYPQCNRGYPECVSVLDESSCESSDSGARRKKKCIRYQHDDDSDEDDFSPLNSPNPYQPFQQNPFDARSVSPAMTSSTNGEFPPTVTPSDRNQPDSRPEIKQEYRSSPPASHDQFNGSENSFKSDESPNSNQDPRNRGDNNNNNNNRKERPNFRHENANPLHRQSSAPPGPFRKSNGQDSNAPGPSGINSRRHSDMPGHESSGHSSDNSPRTHSGGVYGKGPQPSPLYSQGGMYLPHHQNGGNPLLPLSPPYNHSPHGGPFMPISPYLSSLAFPPSPLGSPVLSIFKGMAQSGVSSNNSGANHARGSTGAVVEGKS